MLVFPFAPIRGGPTTTHGSWQVARGRRGARSGVPDRRRGLCGEPPFPRSASLASCLRWCCAGRRFFCASARREAPVTPTLPSAPCEATRFERGPPACDVCTVLRRRGAAGAQGVSRIVACRAMRLLAAFPLPPPQRVCVTAACTRSCVRDRDQRTRARLSPSPHALPRLRVLPAGASSRQESQPWARPRQAAFAEALPSLVFFVSRAP